MQNNQAPVSWYMKGVIGGFAGLIVNFILSYILPFDLLSDSQLLVACVAEAYIPGMIGGIVTNFVGKSIASSVEREVILSLVGGVLGELIMLFLVFLGN